MENKECNKCREIKPLTEFYRRNNRPSGYMYMCKSCVKSSGYHLNRKRQPPGPNHYWQKMKWEYGIDRNKYEEFLNDQGNSCAICGVLEPGGKGRWHIDHDHKCCPSRRSCGNCVRGLLCASCNIALGSFRDNIDLLKSAIRYLEKK